MTASEGHSEIQPVTRRKAASGKVSYSPATVLHDSKTKRVSLVAFYLNRTERTGLAFKLVEQRKPSKAEEAWSVGKERAISFDESAGRSLLRELKVRFAISEEDSDGEYIAIRVSDGVADVAHLDSEVVAQAVAHLLEKKDIVRHLADRELGSELVGALRGAVRLRELRNAVAELRVMLDSNVVDEQEYQRWCEQHCWAFGSMCLSRDQVRQITNNDRLDLLVRPMLAKYRDIIELKRPDMPVLNRDDSHASYYFSADVSKAIGQCHRYLDRLHLEAENGLDSHPEVVAYHPRACIVVGRSTGWSAEKVRALHGLNHRLHGITVMTFDQLLGQGEAMIEVFTAGLEENEGSTLSLDMPESAGAILEDDDITF